MPEPVTEAELISLHPAIFWTQPQPVSVGDLTRLSCRFCTAMYGLSAAELEARGFVDRGDWVAHMAAEHGFDVR